MMKEENLGKCYELGYQYLSTHTDYILVHGYITNKFKPPFQTLDHCWLYKDDVVYDPVHEEEYPKIVYNALFGAESAKEYTFAEALKLANETEHYGCWHEVKDLDIDKYYENGKLKDEYL